MRQRLNGNEMEDGLWGLFNVKAKCNICDDPTNYYILKNKKRIPQCAKCTKVVGGKSYEDGNEDYNNEEEEDEDYDDGDE